MRRITKTNPVCDKDCFHCPFPDCVLDGMDLEDYREARERDFDLRRTPEQKKLAAKQKAYREANREELAAKKKAYYEANREEIAAKQKAYYEANREEIAAKRKAYYEANREELAAKQKIISVCRRAVGITQKVLAEAMGVSIQKVCHIECGRARTDVPAVLAKIAELAHMSVETLMEAAS